jgi:hypothetical protein
MDRPLQILEMFPPIFGQLQKIDGWRHVGPSPLLQ